MEVCDLVGSQFGLFLPVKNKKGAGDSYSYVKYCIISSFYFLKSSSEAQALIKKELRQSFTEINGYVRPIKCIYHMSSFFYILFLLVKFNMYFCIINMAF